MTVNNNSPSTGYISWSGVHMQYKGVSYTISDGYTAYAYIYWTPSSPTTFVVTNGYPSLGADDCLVFLNKMGTALVVPGSTMLDGGLIVPGTILAAAIAANVITSAQILAGSIDTTSLAANAVKANNIDSGAITADKIAANAIGAAAIAANAVSADKLQVDQALMNAIFANSLSAGMVTADNIAAGAIGAAAIAAGAISAEKLQADQALLNAVLANSLSAESLDISVGTKNNATIKTVPYVYANETAYSIIMGIMEGGKHAASIEVSGKTYLGSVKILGDNIDIHANQFLNLVSPDAPIIVDCPCDEAWYDTLDLTDGGRVAVSSDSYITVVKKMGLCFVSGSVTLTSTLGVNSTNDFINVLNSAKIPAPQHGTGLYTTADQWGTSYTRPLRVGIGAGGSLRMRYGEAGNYSFVLPPYPISA